MVVSSARIDAPGSSTTKDVALATTREVKLAAYLMIVATFDDFAPASLNETVPSLVNYFLEEVKDGTVSDSSLDTANKWMDVNGKIPYYINPVNSVMLSEYDLSLTMIATYQWRVKMTAGARNKSRLCASFDGKRKVSRLKSMLPLVARFILAQGPVKMGAQIQAARAADPNSNHPSQTKFTTREL